jgi:hypothetical protein
VAITTSAPIRVADPVMDRLAALAGSGAGRSAPVSQPGRDHGRPRYEPRNLVFGAGLDGWMFDGSLSKHASEAHWNDYSFVAEGVEVIRSAVARPAGFAMLRQVIFADDYRGATVTFRASSASGPAPGAPRAAPGCSCGSTSDRTSTGR